jgi:hypothetical protein
VESRELGAPKEGEEGSVQVDWEEAVQDAVLRMPQVASATERWCWQPLLVLELLF